ncbi:MAG: phage/plasmid primase, P4 family, partial [Chloroflexota bacterium]|nr:phage/plasmid primase, P4 family [Chloroflexota bacterium]
QEIFADREQAERDELITFVQRALGYGISGHVIEHIFLILYGEEGRNGKDTLMSVLAKVLGNTVGAVSNDVIIASGRFTAPGSAKPHLVALQGKRIAWASETDRGACFDASQVKFLTGGGAIAARQLYGKDYSFDPSHLLVLLTNNKPHADASDRAFWSRLCPVLFNMHFVDHPIRPNEQQKDITLGKALEAEASGILAWLVRGCLAWQEHSLQIPASVLRARQDYQGEEDTLGQFFDACCVFTKQASVKASLLYERYKTWTQENTVKPMTGAAFGLELKKMVTSRRDKQGIIYEGVGLLAPDGVGQCSPSHEKMSNPTPSSMGLGSGSMHPIDPSGVGMQGSSRNFPYETEKKEKIESYTKVPTTLHQPTCDETSLSAPVESVEDTKKGQEQPYTPTPVPTRHYVETVDGLGYWSGNARECDVTFTAEEQKAALRWKIGVISLHDGRERFYYPRMMHDVSADVVQAFMSQTKEVQP